MFYKTFFKTCHPRLYSCCFLYPVQLLSENIPTSLTHYLQVNIYAPNGECTKRVSPTDSGGRDFKRPSDMVTLPDGRFLVRDDLGIQVQTRFRKNGNVAEVSY